MAMSRLRGLSGWLLRFTRSEAGCAPPPGRTGRRARALLGWLGWTPLLAGFFVGNGIDDGLQREQDCLALNIYFEARNEPVDGRLAVAHVVMNRAADARWPNTPCEVVREGYPGDGRLCQFSWYCDGLSDRPRERVAWRDAQRLARLVYWGLSRDPTGGALWYHADYVEPAWRLGLRPGPKIGRHIFYFPPQKAARPAKHPA